MSLTFEYAPQLDRPPPIPNVETAFDFTSRLSIDLIREHAKIDDVPSVSDDQLQLYRAASVEAEEHYTGMMLSRQKTVAEPVIQKSGFNYEPYVRPRRNIHKTQQPVADGRVYIYGKNSGPVLIMVAPGSKRVRIPPSYDINLSQADCRDPCAQSVESYIMYAAGFASAADVPAGIILGCLKYCAWCITHPGDEYLSIRNQPAKGEGGATGTSNAAWASGALELWRAYDQTAV